MLKPMWVVKIGTGMDSINRADFLLTPRQVSERLGISERSVKEKAYSGLWPHRRIDGRTLRFTETDYEEIVASSLRRPTTMAKKVNVEEMGRDLAALLSGRRAA